MSRFGRATAAAVAAPVAALLGLLGACGVTQDPAARPIDDVPFGLAAPTTTTSTAPPAPTTEPATTTTTAPPPPPPTSAPTESVVFYYVAPDGRLRAEYRFVPVPAPGARIDPTATLLALKQGPQADRSLTNLVTDGTVDTVLVDRGRAEVWLTDGFLALEPPAQLAVVGQIVLTFTDRPGVGRVVFRTATEAVLTVPRADGTAGAEDATAEDYRALQG